MQFDNLRIIKYQMTANEAKAYRCACAYIRTFRKLFPDSKQYFKKNGDPRKSNLFKFCWKMIDQLKNKILDNQLELFIHAQLKVLQSHKEYTPFVGPDCLVGEKAWKRWLVWNKQYEKNLSAPQAAYAPTVIPLQTICQELDKTKQFLMKKFKRIDQQDILDALENKTMARWIGLGKFSPYYVWLSPIIKNWLDKKNIKYEDYFSVGINVYKNCVSQESTNYFKQIFKQIDV